MDGARPDDWWRAISDAVTHADADVVLVAHSLGCLAVTHWLSKAVDDIGGVLLVAPPDPTGPSFPATAAPTLASVDLDAVGVPGLVVTSD